MPLSFIAIASTSVSLPMSFWISWLAFCVIVNIAIAIGCIRSGRYGFVRCLPPQENKKPSLAAMHGYIPVVRITPAENGLHLYVPLTGRDPSPLPSVIPWDKIAVVESCGTTGLTARISLSASFEHGTLKITLPNRFSTKLAKFPLAPKVSK